MRVKLNERSSKMVELLCKKLKVDPEYVLRISIFETARYILGTPEEFLIFKKSDWDATMGETRKEIDEYWKAHLEGVKARKVKSCPNIEG